MNEDKKKTDVEDEASEVEAQKKGDEQVKFKGRFISAIGRRKTATASVRLYEKGIGAIIVNGRKASEYFPQNNLTVVNQPLKLAGLNKDVNLSVVVTGGGKSGQAEAVRHGITMALLKFNKELRPTMKAKGLVTRDARKKERKKPGLKKARRAPQWSKR